MSKSTAEKVKAIVQMSDCERCYASKARATIIDVLHPVTGLTVCFDRDLADVQREYPDAEEMSVDEFCAWKAQQQRAPITWEPTTAERFDEMLNVLPPAVMVRGGFLVGEAFDHDAGSGRPRYQGFRVRRDADGNETYTQGSRPMTVAEFRKEVAQ